MQIIYIFFKIDFNIKIIFTLIINVKLKNIYILNIFQFINFDNLKK